MTVANQTLLFPKFKAFDSNSVVLAGGKVHTYDAGTTTNRATYSDTALTTPNTNPVILDALGEAEIYLSGNYKIVLKDSDDVTIWTIDNVKGYGLGGLNLKFLSDYEDFATAVTDIGSTETELVIDQDDTMTEAVTVPKTLYLRFLPGNTIDPDGNTLTIFTTENIIAPTNMKIFNGSTDAVFTNEGIIECVWYAASGDGSTASPWADALRNANTANGDGVYHLTGGVYQDTTTISIDDDSVEIFGDGQSNTLINFRATDDTSCLQLKESGQTLTKMFARDLSFNGGSTATGAAIEIEDLRHGGFSNLGFDDFSADNSTSCAFLIKGRDNLSFTKIRATNCTTAFLAQDNPNETAIDTDHFHFEDIFINCGSETNGYGWRIEGTNNYNIIIDGTNSVNRALYGFYLKPTGTASTDSTNISISNLRVEQGTIGEGGYGVRIDLNGDADLQNFTCDNVRVSSGNNGFQLQDIQHAALTNCQVVGGAGVTSLDADTSVDTLVLRNFERASASTFTTTGLTDLTIDSTNEALEIYDSTQPSLTSKTGDVTIKATDGGDPIVWSRGGGSGTLNQFHWQQELADDGGTNLPAGQGLGFAQLGDGEEYAFFSFTTAAAVTLISNSANVSNSSVDGDFCIYDNGSVVRISNRLGSAKDVFVIMFYRTS